MVLKSFFPDVVIPEQPLGQFIVDRLKKFEDFAAMIEAHSGKETTFQQLREETMRIVRLLWKAGLQKGDIVGLVMPFDMQYVPLLIAIIYCRGVLFGTKLLYKSSIHNQLAAVKPTLVVTTNDRYEEISEDLKSNVPSVKLCVSFDQLQTVEPGAFKNAEDDMPCYEAIDVHNDPAIIYQSSGTTGKPKGVVMTHYSVMALIHISMASSPLCPGDVNASMSSIIHLQSLATVFISMCQGISYVYANMLTAEQHLDVVSKYKVNSISVFNVNTFKYMFAQNEHQSKYDLSSLQMITVGGTAFSPQMIQQARTKLGGAAVVSMVYGMTEAGFVAGGRSNRSPPGSVGLLVCNMQLKIVDKDTGKELGCGEKGEICVQGPQIMKDYFVQDGTMLDTLQEGWLHSGDLGYYDKNGYIYVVGRTKDAIKIQPGNVTVMPSELEEILRRHELISDVAVAGVSHPDHGEAPRAFVVRKDESLTEKRVIQFFEKQTEKFSSLHGGVEFVDSIPRTEIGKPLRRELVEKCM